MDRQIKRLIEKAETDLGAGRFNPGQFVQKVEKCLEKYEASEKHCSQYKEISQFLFRTDHISLAIQFLINRWEELGAQQAEKHIHRAAISMELVEFYLRLQDKGGALRWALLTHADDILWGHPDISQCAGKQKLEAVFGMSKPEFCKFDNIAKSNRNQMENWSSPEGFAEDVVLKFAVQHPECAHLLAQESFVSAFPLSTTYFGKLLERVEAPVRSKDNPNGITSEESGKRLEDLASYLFLLIPGWIPLRNRADEKRTRELDIVVRNVNPKTYIADLLGRHFLVECKNWEATLGSLHVGYFLHKMHLTHTKFGIVLAKSGISGQKSDSQDRVHAIDLIDQTWHEDGAVCIALTLDDLKALREGETTFWSMILEKIEHIRFGKPRYSETHPSELRSVSGIGEKHAAALQRLGIDSPSALIKADPQKVADGIHRVSAEMVQKWQESAKTLLEEGR